MRRQQQTQCIKLSKADIEMTREELLICDSIKVQLREFFNISGACGYDVHTHLNMISAAIGTIRLEQLQSEFGFGYIFILFSSVSAFKQRKSFVPLVYKLELPKKCVITVGKNQMIYVPNNSQISTVFAYENTNEICKRGCYPQTAIIYNDWNSSEVYMSYRSVHSAAVYTNKYLLPFFKRKKWSAKHLRKNYRDFVYLFLDSQLIDISYIMRTCLRLHPISDLLFPKNFIHFVKDATQKQKIEHILHNIYGRYPESIEIYEQTTRMVQKSWVIGADMETIFLKTMNTFVLKEINKIISIIGNEEFVELFYQSMKENIGWMKHIELLLLIKRIHGRKCSYEMCLNQENRSNPGDDEFVYEKYKTCSKCRQVFYCSKSCQKRDWRHHREMCTKMYYFMCKEVMKVDFI